MTTINPPAVPASQQTLEQLAPRMTVARRDLITAVRAGQVRWHRPPGNSVSRTTWARKVVTGEVNWLRSHGLAMLGTSTTNKRDGTTRPVILTDHGHELLSMLSSGENQ